MGTVHFPLDVPSSLRRFRWKLFSATRINTNKTRTCVPVQIPYPKHGRGRPSVLRSDIVDVVVVEQTNGAEDLYRKEPEQHPHESYVAAQVHITYCLLRDYAGDEENDAEEGQDVHKILQGPQSKREHGRLIFAVIRCAFSLTGVSANHWILDDTEHHCD